MKEALVLACIFTGTIAFIRIGIYVGSRYIDKMLCFDRRDIDPDRPLE